MDDLYKPYKAGPLTKERIGKVYYPKHENPIHDVTTWNKDMLSLMLAASLFGFAIGYITNYLLP